jgi:hypothetical protein
MNSVVVDLGHMDNSHKLRISWPSVSLVSDSAHSILRQLQIQESGELDQLDFDDELWLLREKGTGLKASGKLAAGSRRDEVKVSL